MAIRPVFDCSRNDCHHADGVPGSLREQLLGMLVLTLLLVLAILLRSL